MIYKINTVMQESLSQDNQDHYAFMVPIMKVEMLQQALI